MNESIQCKIIPHNADEEFTYHPDPVIFDSIDRCPINLISGKKYIFTKWDQNVIVEAVHGITPDPQFTHSFKVLESFYGDIKLGEEYLVLKPKY